MLYQALCPGVSAVECFCSKLYGLIIRLKMSALLAAGRSVCYMFYLYDRSCDVFSVKYDHASKRKLSLGPLSALPSVPIKINDFNDLTDSD